MWRSVFVFGLCALSGFLLAQATPKYNPFNYDLSKSLPAVRFATSVPFIQKVDEEKKDKQCIKAVCKKQVCEDCKCDDKSCNKDCCKCSSVPVLEDSTVMLSIKNKEGRPISLGTGFIFHGANKETYVWTAAHVIADIVAEVLDPENDRMTYSVNGFVMASWDDKNEDGDRAGFKQYPCEVLRYSRQTPYPDGSPISDLAILKINKKSLGYSVKFEEPSYRANIGDVVWHMGLMGQRAGGLMQTRGFLGSRGVHYAGQTVIAASITTLPGSSGGPIVTPDNKLLGMLTGGIGETYSLIIPHYSMIKWADAMEAKWAYNNEEKRHASDRFYAD